MGMNIMTFQIQSKYLPKPIYKLKILNVQLIDLLAAGRLIKQKKILLIMNIVKLILAN